MKPHQDKPMTNSTSVPLSSIRVDGGTQTRAVLCQNTVREYAEAYSRGDPMPPVVVFDDGTDMWMADGFHRYAAAKLARLETINAEVRKGTQRDALLYAVGCNASHGLRRTRADKVKAV